MIFFFRVFSLPRITCSSTSVLSQDAQKLKHGNIYCSDRSSWTPAYVNEFCSKVLCGRRRRPGWQSGQQRVLRNDWGDEEQYDLNCGIIFLFWSNWGKRDVQLVRFPNSFTPDIQIHVSWGTQLTYSWTIYKFTIYYEILKIYIVLVSCVWEVELILKFKCQAAAALPKQHGESWWA